MIFEKGQICPFRPVTVFFNQLKEKIILIKMSFLSRIYCSQELVKNLLRVETDEAVFLCVTAQMYITFDAVNKIFFIFYIINRWRQ